MIRPIRKIAEITGFFAAVGPPLGSFVFWIGAGVVGALYSTFTFTGNFSGNFFDVVRAPLILIGFAIFGMPLGYVYGIAPACLAGLAVGILHINHRSNYLSVLVVGICVGSGYGFAFKSFFPDQTLFSWAVALTCIPTTFLCWRGIRNWYAPDVQLDGKPA
jgi:hypothetical protein